MDTNNNEVLEQNNIENGNVVETQNEVVQNEVVQNDIVGNSYSDDVGQKNKKNFMVLIVMALVIALIGACIVFLPSLFKSDEQKFFDLLLKKQSVASFANELNEKAMKDGQVNSTLEMDFNEIAETMGEELEEDLAISLDISQGKKKDNISGSVGINLNKDALITIEYAKTDDMFGLRVKDATEDFIAIQNKDLDKLMEKFGAEDVEGMPDKLLTQEDFEKVMKIKESDVNKMANKYIKVLANSVDGRVEVEKGVKVKFGDKEIKATKYTLPLTERATMDMLLAVIEELKDDEKNVELVMNDVKAIFDLLEDNGYPVEDMYGISSDDLPDTDEILEAIEEIYDAGKEEDFDDYDDDEVLIEISVYEYKGEAVATEFESETGEKIIFKCLSDKELYIALVAEDDGDELASFVIDGKFDGKELDAKLVVESYGEKLEIFTIKQEYKNKAENFVELSKKNALIINDASEEEIQEYGEEFMMGMEKIAEDLQDVIPAELMSGAGSVTTPSYDYDMDYDYNYDDFDYDYDIDNDYTYTPSTDYESSWENDTVEKTGILADAQSMYNKISVGDTEAVVTQKLGEPDVTSTFGNFVYHTYNSTKFPDENVLVIAIIDGVVYEKEISLYSSEYRGISLSKEMNSKIEDLNVSVLKLKKDMTIQEVQAALGDPGYEQSVNEYGDITYEWYDKKENSITVSFDEDGKAYYISSVW